MSHRPRRTLLMRRGSSQPAIGPPVFVCAGTTSMPAKRAGSGRRMRREPRRPGATARCRLSSVPNRRRRPGCSSCPACHAASARTPPSTSFSPKRHGLLSFHGTPWMAPLLADSPMARADPPREQPLVRAGCMCGRDAAQEGGGPGVVLFPHQEGKQARGGGRAASRGEQPGDATALSPHPLRSPAPT